MLHYSGSLLDWITARKPAFIERLARLAASGQVEFLSGGYYEPILPSIPDEDKIGQIRKLSARLGELFQVQPAGMWLAERVWEPHLARPIAAAGLHYTIVDDTHFKDAGIEELDRYYRTEEEGCALDIFPISEELRYLIPFKPPSAAIDFFSERRSSERPGLFVLADDGENWWLSGTRGCLRKGWLEQPFSLPEGCWSGCKRRPSANTAFFPHWPICPPAPTAEGWSGFWRNFFFRYPGKRIRKCWQRAATPRAPCKRKPRPG